MHAIRLVLALDSASRIHRGILRRYFRNPSAQLNFCTFSARPENPQLKQWLAAKSNRLNLASIGFKIVDSIGNTLDSDSFVPRCQTGNIYIGIVESSFTALGEIAHIKIISHHKPEIVAVCVKLHLLKSEKLKAFFNPCADIAISGFSGDWNAVQKHSTIVKFLDAHGAALRRVLDADTYFAAIKFPTVAKLNKTRKSHEFELSCQIDTLEFLCELTAKQQSSKSLPTFDEAKTAYPKMRVDFWQNGAFVGDCARSFHVGKSEKARNNLSISNAHKLR